MKLIQTINNNKLRGGFYTPPIIAKFIIDWALNGSENFDILEPSCGDGVFLKLLKSRKYNSVTAIELDEIEAQKANNVDIENKVIINDDFHSFFHRTENRFDVIIGNPPYIRYQYFDRDQQIEAKQIFTKADLKYSKLMNAWVSFVVGSSLLLKPEGRIGFVLPAEILQVSYAHELRNFIAKYFNKIIIVSFKKLVFQDVQQEVILLLCEKNKSGHHKIEHIELNNADDLPNLNIGKLKAPGKNIDFKANKWTFYFLEQNEIDFLEEIIDDERMPRIKDFAKVEVGITTGDNHFFTVPLSTINEYNLQAYAKPMVGRSVQVPSLDFTENDWRENQNNGARAHFLMFPLLKEMNGNIKAVEYIKLGENLGINKGYKCRIRDEWQIVPSTRISDALFIRRNNIFPKLIINSAKAHTTDTMHRVWINNQVDIKAFTSSYYNSLSLAFAEISGRSHGGGVLELMPNEAENIILPYNLKNSGLLNEIDIMLRSNCSIDRILEVTNKTILKENFGFSQKDIILADTIRTKLLNRRLMRGK